MKKILNLFLFQLFFMSIGVAQCGEEDNYLQNKYWQLREQFSKHFIKVDLDEDGNLLSNGIGDFLDNQYTKAGYSLPAAQLYMQDRDSAGVGVVHPHGDYINGEGEPGTNNIINFGADNTYTLGMYIAMLASEYGLLKQNGDPSMQKTLNELYLALQAIRRLDMTANKLNSEFCACNDGNVLADLSGYSGFLLRSDAPGSFHNEIDDESYSDDWRVGGVRSPFATWWYSDGLPCNFRYHDDDIDSRKRIAGQDQIIGLLFGLAFVKKFVPEDATVHYINDYYVLDIAEKIAHGMVRRIRENPGRFIKYPPCANEKEKDWGPRIDDTFGEHAGGNGGNAKAHIHGMIKLLDYIWPENNVNSTAVDIFNWNAARLALDVGQTNDNARMITELMTAGDTNFGSHAQELTTRCGGLNYMQLYAWAVLHDKDLLSSGAPEATIEMPQILSRLGCEGSCNKAPQYNGLDFYCSNSENDWCSGERWKHSCEVISDCAVLNGVKNSNYDYMLAYNLYHLYTTPYPTERYFNPFDDENENEPDEDHICGPYAICLDDIVGTEYSLGIPSSGLNNVVWDKSDNLTWVYHPEQPVRVEVIPNTSVAEEAWISVEFYVGQCRFKWKKVISIGIPELPIVKQEINTPNPCTFSLDLGIDPVLGFSYDWEITFNGNFGSTYSTSYHSNAYAAVTNVEGNGVIQYTVIISNDCEEQEVSGAVYIGGMQCNGFDGPNISLSPNPANDHIDVELINVPFDIFANGGSIDYFLIDQYSNIKKTVTSTNLIETINTSDLPNGLYHILGELGDQTINSSTIVIQH